MEGPPEEVEKARESLEQQSQDLVARMSFVEINVDAKYHKHIIGKGGSTGEMKSYYILMLVSLFSVLMKLSCASSDWSFARASRSLVLPGRFSSLDGVEGGVQPGL